MSTYIYFNSNDTKVQVGISEYKIIRSDIVYYYENWENLATKDEIFGIKQ